MKNSLKKSVDRPLTISESRFVQEYLVDLDVDLAAPRAGIAPMVARGLLQAKRIQDAIARERRGRLGRTQIYGDEVLRRWWQLATADVRELTQVRFVNCRYCWGIDHRFQYRDHELQEALARHRASEAGLPPENRTAFDDLGGGGFNGQADPCRGLDWASRAIAHGGDPDAVAAMVNAERAGHVESSCPACDGEGVETVWVADSRTLSPAAAVLFNGVKISKDGRVEIQVRDRDKAHDRVAQHLGLLVKKTVQVNLDPSQLTDEQLEQALEQFSRLVGRGPTVIEHEGAGAEDDD